VVFRDLYFELPAGRALLLNGANGSGKSSLLKIISGLLSAQGGNIISHNKDISQNILDDKDWISRNICYLAHKNGLKLEMTVAENLKFWANMEHHANMGHLEEDIRTEAIKIGLEHCLDLPVYYLSSGQARRAALMRVLCHPGRIWLLDEPTVGLDKSGVKLLSGLMNDHLARGGSILAATHIQLGIDADKTTMLNMSDFAFSTATSPEYGPPKYNPKKSLLC